MRRLALALLLVLAAPAAASAQTAPPGAFVSLADVDPTIRIEMRYRTAHNFVGRRIRGYDEDVCLLTRQAADALRLVQAEVRRAGYSLKVYDCYRPQRAVNVFVRWARDLDDTRMKREFYPRVRKNRLFKDGYIASRSGHSRGSTVDLTLTKLTPRRQEPYAPRRPAARLRRPARRRFRDNTIDMGTGYDCFDVKLAPVQPARSAARCGATAWRCASR